MNITVTNKKVFVDLPRNSRFYWEINVFDAKFGTGRIQHLFGPSLRA